MVEAIFLTSNYLTVGAWLFCSPPTANNPTHQHKLRMSLITALPLAIKTGIPSVLPGQFG